MKIKSQPLLRWLYYPASPMNNAIHVHRDIAQQFLSLRNKVGKPVYLTNTFINQIVKTNNAFYKFYHDAVKSFEGESGVIVVDRLYADGVPTADDAHTIIWSVKNGELSFILFSLYEGQSYNYAWATSTFDNGGTKMAGWDCDWRSVRYPQYFVDPDRHDYINDRLCHCATLIVSGYFCLRKWATVELVNIKPNKTVRIKGENEPISLSGDVPMTIMDCRWFREISSDKEFLVSGHFRLQPYKDESGVWDKKLIYIDEYVKHGYHRKAGIQKVNDTQSLN